MRVDISAEAEGDLEAIGDYIARESPSRAIRVLRDLREKCLDLAAMPEAFPVVDRFDKLGIRRRVHGPYLIFYQVAPSRIVVLHVLHGAMDYGPILFPDDG